MWKNFIPFLKKKAVIIYNDNVRETSDIIHFL